MKTTSLAAILFVELAGFAELLARDEAKAIALLKAYRDLVDPIVEEHGGETVDATGDELLVIFGSAVSAVQCALHIRLSEQSLAARLPRIEALSPRAGIHLGEIWRDESRVYGNGINVAARVKAEAGPGQILISEDVYRQVSNKLDLPLRAIPGRHLKNIERNLAIYEIGNSAWTEEAPRVEERLTGDMEAAMPAPPEPPQPPGPIPPPAREIGRDEIKSAFRKVIEKAIVDNVRIEMSAGDKDGRLTSMKLLIDEEGRHGAGREEAGDGEDEADLEEAAESPEGAENAHAATDVARTLSERRFKASTDISKGAINFLVAGAVFGGFLFFYLKSPSLLLAAGAALFGLGPALSGLKRFLRGIFDLRDVRKDEGR
jgi:class 3 adenylate cyclase